MSERTMIAKPDHGSAEWHRIRWADEAGHRRLNASAAAVLFNEHRYLTQGRYAAIQLASHPPEEDTPSDAQDRGHALEPALLAWLGRRLGEPIETPEWMVVRGRWVATLDGIRVNGEPCEAKTSNDWAHGQPMPAHWRWQGVAQAYVCDRNRLQWVALDKYLRLDNWVQTVTDEEVEQLTTLGEQWLAFIDMGIPPQGVHLTASDVAVMYPFDEIAKVELPTELYGEVVRLHDARVELARWKKEEAAAKDALAVALKDASVGTIDGTELVTWKASKPYRRFDEARFKLAEPELWETYLGEERANRTMRVLGHPSLADPENDEGNDEP